MFDKLFEELKKMKEFRFDKKEFVSRTDALPHNYQVVFKGMCDYIWSTPYSGMGGTKILLDMLERLENGVKENKDVLEIIGSEDIIGYCDELLKEISEEHWKEKAKKDMNKKIIDDLK